MSAAEVVAVVPVRDAVSGKSRLATALAPYVRRRLVAELTRHVVGVLVASHVVDEIVVVTADVRFVEETLASLRHPVRVLRQPSDGGGLNGALDQAREDVRGRHPGARLLVAHADLPALGVQDVDALVRAEASVVVATDRRGTGTNLLALPADAEFQFRFGLGSRAAHVAEAVARGLDAVVVRRAGTAADLDTLDDWEELPEETRTRLVG